MGSEVPIKMTMPISTIGKVDEMLEYPKGIDAINSAEIGDFPSEELLDDRDNLPTKSFNNND
ncbi:MAG: hypothetical protein C4K58_03405 [Flavobacteriaceae bacterium]|nr:MAG: hypothetical protein C4K58_03405 [Flavobacteriaceae bacterium]